MAIDNPVTHIIGSQRLARTLEETAAIASELLPEMLRSGVVSLDGPLGAGKTHFVKATALALGITDIVTSPTFTLLHRYGSEKAHLYHCDWYRLESASEALSLGLEEYYDQGVMLIEWGGKFLELLPPTTLCIMIEPRPDESRLFSWKTKA